MIEYLGFFFGLLGLILSVRATLRGDRLERQSTDDQKQITDLYANLRFLESHLITHAPFWSALQKELAIDLHRPDVAKAELDTLMVRLVTLTITPAGRLRLEELLAEQIANPEATEDERDKADILLRIMPLVIKETAHHS